MNVLIVIKEQLLYWSGRLTKFVEISNSGKSVQIGNYSYFEILISSSTVELNQNVGGSQCLQAVFSSDLPFRIPIFQYFACIFSIGLFHYNKDTPPRNTKFWFTPSGSLIHVIDNRTWPLQDWLKCNKI